MRRRQPRQQTLHLMVKEEQQCLFHHLEQAPKVVRFESTCDCNANCSFCANPKMQRAKGTMPMAVIEQIAQQATGARMLIPCSLGEPLLDQRMRQILALCKRLQPQATTALFSNMSLCDRETAAWLVADQTLDRLYPSFHGPNPLIYRQMQPSLDFHTVRQNIIHLIRERQAQGKRKPLLEMQYIMTETTAPYAAQFQKYWGAIADSVSLVPSDTWHGLLPDRSLSALTPTPPGPIPCSRLWDSLHILHDGRAVACCIDLEATTVIGRFPEQSFTEIWHGQSLRTLRRLHLAGKQSHIPLCRDCTFWKSGPKWWVDFWSEVIYGGCRLP